MVLSGFHPCSLDSRSTGPRGVRETLVNWEAGSGVPSFPIYLTYLYKNPLWMDEMLI